VAIYDVLDFMYGFEAIDLRYRSGETKATEFATQALKQAPADVSGRAAEAFAKIREQMENVVLLEEAGNIAGAKNREILRGKLSEVSKDFTSRKLIIQLAIAAVFLGGIFELSLDTGGGPGSRGGGPTRGDGRGPANRQKQAHASAATRLQRTNWRRHGCCSSRARAPERMRAAGGCHPAHRRADVVMRSDAASRPAAVAYLYEGPASATALLATIPRGRLIRCSSTLPRVY
jgi:hypothetical protein